VTLLHLHTLRRTSLAALLVLGLLWVAAGPAAAAEGSIDHVQNVRGSVQVLYSLPQSSNGTPDLGSVSVTLDGSPLQAKAVPASNGDSRIRRTTVLAIDVSKSMGAGGKFAEAKQAANAFLSSIPADVYVGVVTFAGSVRVAQQPSLDRSASRRVIGRLRLSLGTHLYDGVSRAVDVTGRTGQRSVLVLSDGRDTSRTPLAGVTKKLSTTKTKVDVVALAQGSKDRRLIQPLSDAGGGSVISAADPKQLSKVFSTEARILADQLLVTVTPPSSTTVREGTLAVAVSADGQTYTDSAFVAIPRTKAATPAPRHPATVLTPAPTGSTVSANVMLGGLTAIGIGCVVLVLAILGGMGKNELSLEKRIAAYTGKGTGQRVSTPAPQGVAAQAVDIAAKALASNRGFEARLASRLDVAGMSLKPAEWLLLHAGIAVGTAIFLMLLTGGVGLLVVLGLVGGVLLPWFYLGMKRSRRLKAFNAQLPATLQLMAGSLQAGLSLAQGMDTIVREGADPIAGEFRRALVETRLGVQVEDALDSIAERMTSDDFRWTVMAVRIQREVGGNLAELMLNVAATMREREYLRRQVKSLSAEGRFSAYILLVMPPGVLMYEATTNRHYLSPLISTPIGWLMLSVMGVMMGLGAFMMSRMIKLEV
jgi:tight adherence protein B